jgi:DNA sulfur modification protein DndE
MRRVLCLALFSVSVSFASNVVTDLGDLEFLAADAYVYAYPLVTMDVTRQVMTNCEQPSGAHAPMGQFAHMRQYPTPQFTDVPSPNADTLYSTAWIDLSEEPYVLSLPDMEGRYFLFPMLSAWSDVFVSLGTRTTGTEAKTFVITGPNWQGTLPKDLIQIRAPTNMVWILGRIYCSGTQKDYEAVHKLQDQITLQPLHTLNTPYTPPKGVVDLGIDMKTPVRDQIRAMDPVSYFSKFAQLLRENPPSDVDAALLSKLGLIGIEFGKPFDEKQVESKQTLKNAAERGQRRIFDFQNTFDQKEHGWILPTTLGRYGTHYELRAYIAAVCLGANLPQDAIYLLSTTDESGKPLNGKRSYVLHFSKDDLPPVRGFWSLTMYSKQYFFVPNVCNRFSVGSKDALKFNEDGSLDIYIQKDSPAGSKESNWLPSPDDEFVLMLRLYWPEFAALSGAWMPPEVVKHK